MKRYTNNSGVVLPIILLIILILTFLGTAFWRYSVQDTIYAENNEKRMQAYYLARSGADALAQYIIDNPDGIDMKQFVDQLVAAPQSEPTYISSEVDGYFQVEVSRDEDEGLIIIESVGTVDDISRKAVLTLREIINGSDDEWTEPPLDMAVFAQGFKEYSEIKDFIEEKKDIEKSTYEHTAIGLIEGGQIEKGNIGVNSIEPGAVKLDGGVGINGYVFIGPGGDAEEFADKSGPHYNKIAPDKIQFLDEEREYKLPSFPEFPENLPWRGSFTAGWWPSPPYNIYEDGEYDDITVESELVIHIGDKDRIIKVNTLNLSKNSDNTDNPGGTGDIILEKEGDGRLILYVEESIIMEGDSSININGNPNDIFVYYKGDSPIKFPGDVKFSACLYAENADIEIVNGSNIEGHIITGGKKVTLSGGTDTHVKAIYAPFAVVNVTEGAKFWGSIVCDRFYGSGGVSVRINYDDSFKETFYEFWRGGGEDTVVYKMGKWK